MALNYEQLAPALYKQAGSLAAKSNLFQVHELVAECWLMGNVQKLKTIKFAQKRAYYDMLDYIRSETGSRNRQRAERLGRFIPRTYSLQTLMSPDDDDSDSIEDFQGRSDPVPEQIDIKDLFERLCKGLSRQESLIMRLIYIDGLDQVETGVAIGVSESRISQMLSNLLPRIRIILENLGYENRMQPKPEPDRAEYKRLWRQEKLNRKRHALRA